MPDSLTFAVDVFRTVCDRLRSKAADLRLLVEGGSSFEAWLHWEAYLACKLRQESYPFCEVEATPTYASEGVAGGGDPDRAAGDLRVGGPDGGANHCWLFAEFVVVGDRPAEDWKPKISAAADRLKRLGWKKSAALLIVIATSRGNVLTEWTDFLAGRAAGYGPALTDPFVITLSGGGSVAVKAFDIKQIPADVLTTGCH